MGMLVCKRCEVEKPIPKCCNDEEMKSEGPNLICTYCNSMQYFPFHCGQMMAVKK